VKDNLRWARRAWAKLDGGEGSNSSREIDCCSSRLSESEWQV